MKVVCIPSLAVSRTWEIILVERVLMFIKKKNKERRNGADSFSQGLRGRGRGPRCILAIGRFISKRNQSAPPKVNRPNGG